MCNKCPLHFASYDDLVKRAAKAYKKKNKKHFMPMPWNLIHLCLKSPCESSCSSPGEKTHVLNIISLGCFISLLILDTYLIKAYAWIWKIIPLIDLLPCIWMFCYPAWFDHWNEMKRNQLTPNHHPDKLIEYFILRQFEKIKEECIGSNSNIQRLKQTKTELLEQAHRIFHELQTRHNDRPEGEHKHQLKNKIKEIEQLIEKLTLDVQRVNKHLQNFSLELSEYETEIQGIASDMALMKEAEIMIENIQGKKTESKQTLFHALNSLQDQIHKLNIQNKKIPDGTLEPVINHPSISKDLKKRFMLN